MNFQEAITKLEFDKVLRQVTRFATSGAGRALLLSSPILTDVEAVTAELSLVSEMKSLIEREGDLPLSGIKEVESAVRRAAVTGTLLTPKELLDIVETMRAGRA